MGDLISDNDNLIVKSNHKLRELNISPLDIFKLISVIDALSMAKLGNIVAETLFWMQMFPSLGARETYVVWKQILLLGNLKCFCLESKTFLLPGHKFCIRNICFPVLPR